MDYRSLGFRECAAEVARYLVTCEGMDIQDPLRLRLMSHLQCFSAQREAAAKASLQNSQWNMSAHHNINMNVNMNSQYSNPPGPVPSLMPPSQHSSHQSEQLMTSHPSTLPTMPSVSCTSGINQHSDSMNSNIGNHHMRLPTTGSVAPHIPSVTSSSSLVAPSLQHHTPQFPVSLSMNSLPMLSPSGAHSYSPTTSSSLANPSASVKPYRPWGGELAY